MNKNMRKILLLLGLGLVALTGCKKDSTPALVESPTLPPATESFAPGASVAVWGTGFTAVDEIWFRAQTEDESDTQAEIVLLTDNELIFTVPQVSAGEHTVILKRDGREMNLGTITVAEVTLYVKLYGIGRINVQDDPHESDTEMDTDAEDSDVDTDNAVLWEIDKTTGEMTELVQLPVESDNEEWWRLPVVVRVNGNVYCYKKIETGDSERFDLYRVNLSSKTLDKVGQLKDNNETENYYLCVIDSRLHALIEKESEAGTFYSLVSIDPNTAAQTVVADFGSLHQALNIPTSVSAGLDDSETETLFCYDATTRSLILSIFKDTETDDWQLVKLDIAGQKIIPGEQFNGDACFTLFSKDGAVCGAFYNKGLNSVDFRSINTESLTAGDLLGSAATENNEAFYGETWVYDGVTNKSYTVMEKTRNASGVVEQYVIGVFDFNTGEFSELASHATNFELWAVFN